MHRHGPCFFYCSTTSTTQPKPARQHAHPGGPRSTLQEAPRLTTLHTSLEAMPAVSGFLFIFFFFSVYSIGIYYFEIPKTTLDESERARERVAKWRGGADRAGLGEFEGGLTFIQAAFTPNLMLQPNTHWTHGCFMRSGCQDWQNGAAAIFFPVVIPGTAAKNPTGT